jgi:hypothetical protein
MSQTAKMQSTHFIAFKNPIQNSKLFFKRFLLATVLIILDNGIWGRRLDGSYSPTVEPHLTLLCVLKGFGQEFPSKPLGRTKFEVKIFVDSKSCRNAYVAIKKTSKFIQESNQKSANRAKLADVQRKIEANKAIEDLISSKRQYFFEGPAVCLEKVLAFNSEKPRYVFAFNDLFLITEDTGKGYRLHYNFVLKDTQMNIDDASKLSSQFNTTRSLCHPDIRTCTGHFGFQK